MEKNLTLRLQKNSSGVSLFLLLFEPKCLCGLGDLCGRKIVFSRDQNPQSLGDEVQKNRRLADELPIGVKVQGKG